MATPTRRNKLTPGDITKAYRFREQRLATEPLATSVHYDGARDAVVVEMNNGAALVIPRRLLQGLDDASPAQLKYGSIAGQGTAIGWPRLDVDFSVMSLLHGIYGGKRWMSELARHAGATKSKAKAAAARTNGAKGGRPRKKSARV